MAYNSARSLFPSEVAHLKQIAGLDERRSALQDLVLKEWLKTGKGVFEGYTGVGKSYLVEKVLKVMEKYPNKNTLIVAPTIELVRDFKERFPKIEVMRHQAVGELIDKKVEMKYDLLIVD